MKIIFHDGVNRPKGIGDSLSSSPENLIYQTDPFLAFLQAVTGARVLRLMAVDGGNVTGVISWCEKSSSYGTVVNSLPWYGSYGACVLSSEAEQRVRLELVESYASYLGGIGDLLSSVTILSPFENEHLELYRSCLRPNAEDSRIGQVTRLPDAGANLEERLFAMFTEAKRRAIRKAFRQKFSFAVTDDDDAWNFLCATHQENMAAIGGRSKPAEHFEAIRQYLPPEKRELLLASLNGEPVAALLLLTHSACVEYVTPVIKHAFRPLQPLSFLIMHGMTRAVERGALWWNWGGTWHSQHSLHRFKAGFGAMDMPYTYIIQCEKDFPELLINNPEISEAFPWMYLYPYHLLPARV